MANAPANHPGPGNKPSLLNARMENARNRRLYRLASLALLATAVLLAPLLLAQGNAQITGVDPTSGKVNDSITVTGENLGKGSVTAVFLSDDKDDFKATIVEQSDGKIVMKVPQVKSGSYNISVQVGDKILIKPVKFSVAE